MIKITTSDIEMIQSSFQAITSTVEEAEITLDEKQLEIKAINNNHTVCLELQLPQESFDVYQVNTTQTFFINTKQLNNILQTMRKDELLTLLKKPDETTLTIQIYGLNEKIYKLNLISELYKQPQLPKIDYPQSISMSTKAFQEAIKDIKLATEDKITLIATQSKLIFSSQNDFTSAEISYSHYTTIKEECESAIAIEHIQHIIKASKFADVVEIQFGADTPVLIMFEDKLRGNFKFLIAPIIE